MPRFSSNFLALRIAIGPYMPGWGSWDWVGTHLIATFSKNAHLTTFSAWEGPEADVALMVKHAPPQDWMEKVAKRSAVIFLPVDSYGSDDEIDVDASLLRQCSRILIHCERLRRHFEGYAPVEYLDHPIKYAAPLRKSFQKEGSLLWVGVRSNLPPLVEWVN